MCHQSVEDPWLLMSVLARLLVLLSAFLGHSSGLASRSGDRDGCLAGDTESLHRGDQSEGSIEYQPVRGECTNQRRVLRVEQSVTGIESGYQSQLHSSHL